MVLERCAPGLARLADDNAMRDLTYFTSTDQRCEQSEVEQEIISRLQALGIPVVPQVKLGNNWVFDGAITGTKIIVEIHGDYWHTRPEVKERDARKQAWADQEGYLILTIWETEYQQDADAALLTILEHYEAIKATAAELTNAVMHALGGDKGDTPPVTPASVYGDWRDRFLAQLSETGIVREACIAAGVSRKTVYQHRADDPDFAEAWKLALQDAADLALVEYRRRALQQSDRAMEFFIKSRDPESYRETSRLEVTGENGGPIDVELTVTERARRVAELFESARARRAGSAADEGAA
jgi:very-short-patch-repair endonuclease